MSDNTDTQAVISTAYAAVPPQEMEKGSLYSVIVPEGFEQVTLETDPEWYNERPPRAKGLTILHDAASLNDFVTEHEGEASKVYADLRQFRFVAVFNDAWKSPTGDTAPGWADHRAQLTLTKTPEWLHWEGKNGQMMTQGAFAEHIEDGLAEIVDPEAAEMLELAQTFHANTGVAFKSSTILASGQRQIQYEETTTAKAGQQGTVTIPQEFVLGLAPFEGSDPYRIKARFRFSVRDGDLKIGYKLDRPHDVLKSAFDDTVALVTEAVESPVFRGLPVGT